MVHKILLRPISVSIKGHKLINDKGQDTRKSSGSFIAHVMQGP